VPARLRLGSAGLASRSLSARGKGAYQHYGTAGSAELYYRITRIEVSILNITEDTKLEELERIKGELRELMPLLSKWRVEELQSLISKHYTTKWKHRKFRKYGAINKGFTQEELERFLGAIKIPRFRLLFEYQAYLGFRVGEVCKVNMKDFDFEKRELRVHTEKAHTLDVMRIPQFLYDETLAYIRANTKEIDEAEGYLFYVTNRRIDSEPYLNLNYIRKVFRYHISLAGLNQIYDATEETSPNRAKRNLHRLTTHSLRHYAITKFNRAVAGDIMLTKAYARHRDVSSTQVYVHTSREEVFDATERAFSENNIMHTERLVK
jgi:integrase